MQTRTRRVHKMSLHNEIYVHLIPVGLVSYDFRLELWIIEWSSERREKLCADEFSSGVSPWFGLYHCTPSL